MSLDDSDYKLIEIPNISPSEKEIMLMDQFSEKNVDYFYFCWEDHKVQFFFNTIDMEKFRKEIEKQNLPADNIFNQILIEVEKIRSFGIKGKKRIYVGYNEARKVENRKEKTQNRQMFYYAQDHSFNEKNTILPEEFQNKIVCADSEAFLKKIPDNCIDLVFTSPPYNFGLDYQNEGNDSVHWTQYLEKLNAILKECIRVLKFGGRMIINVQPLFSDYIPIHHMLTQFMMSQKMIWKGEILWEKNNYNCKFTAWGSWKSPSNPYLKYTWEFLEIFCKGSLKHEGNSELADITPDEFKKWVYAKWSIAPERNMADWGHPAMFPEKLVEQSLKLFSFEQDIILDPFNGVGTTVKVAKDLNRKFLGIDISEEYCRKANERLKGAGAQKRLKIPKNPKTPVPIEEKLED